MDDGELKELDVVGSGLDVLKVVKFPFSLQDYRDILVVFTKDLTFEYLQETDPTVLGSLPIFKWLAYQNIDIFKGVVFYVIQQDKNLIQGYEILTSERKLREIWNINFPKGEQILKFGFSDDGSNDYI